jgi:ABC-type antimicrobial peptide transport system permease subunit
MFLNYLKIAFRNIRRQKLYTIINVTGLAIGMASSILILLFVYDELTFDKFHENADQIYRVYFILEENGKKLPIALTPSPLAAALKNDYPEVSDAVCVKRGGRILIRYQDKWTTAESTNYTYPSFFDIFSFTFIQGSRAKALIDPNSIVLTESLAKKIFEEEDPISKTLHVRDMGDLNVTGVIKDQKNTHIRLGTGAILPFGLYKEERPRMDPWQRINYSTYVLLQKNAEPEAVNQKIADYPKKRYGPEVKARFQLQPIKAIWLHSHLVYDFLKAPYDIRVIHLIITVAVFLLITASVNYMNLATAQSEHRIEEMGLRKVMGASRMQIILQFLGEAILLSCIALVCAIILAEIFLPGFNNLIEIKEVILFENESIGILMAFLLVAVLTGIISGSYPALFVSSFQPAEIIRRQMTSGPQGTVLRKFLVITQFTISIMLIITTLNVHAQLKYMLTKDLGYNPENLLYLPLSEKVRHAYGSIKESLLQHAGISHVTAVLNLPDWRGPSTELSEWEGNPTGKKIRMYHGSVDYDFIDTFQMRIVRGTDFSKKSSPEAPSGLIVNEEAVRLMGLKEPIGKRLTMWNHDGRIIGVVKNFHFNNVKYNVDPLVLKMAPAETRILVIRILPENVPVILSFIEDNLQRVDPDYAFQPEFLSDALNRMYTLEKKMSQLFGYSTFLAILISCLGLFGLSAYTTAKRTKELAIRKACGATTTLIVKMLSEEFVKLVLIANLLAWPIAYFALNHWLQNYAYHIRIGAAPFLVSTVLALVIALMTVGYQAIKAARANPVNSLRYE